MSLVVTGESGDLGVALALRAQRDGVPVTVVLPVWAAESAPQEVVHRLQDPESEIAGLLHRLSPRTVIHFPWLGGGAGRSGRRRRFNVDATLATAAAAAGAGAERFVYWGSVGAYTRAPTLAMRPLSESAPLVNSGPGADLAAADRRLREWAAGCSRPALILLRAATLYAPDSDPLLARWLGLRLLPRPAHAVPLQFLHPLDALAILWRAAGDAVPGVYNAASDEVMLSSELARGLGAVSVSLAGPAAWLLLAAQAGPLAATRMLPLLYRPLVVDNARLKTHFGYRPRYTARQAMVLAVAD